MEKKLRATEQLNYSVLPQPPPPRKVCACFEFLTLGFGDNVVLVGT